MDLYYKRCRFCACESVLSMNLFCDAARRKNMTSKIRTYLSLKVTQSDGLPEVICYQCLWKIESFHNFKVKCDEAEHTLRNWVYFFEGRSPTRDIDIVSLYDDLDEDEECVDDISVINCTNSSPQPVTSYWGSAKSTNSGSSNKMKTSYVQTTEKNTGSSNSEPEVDSIHKNIHNHVSEDPKQKQVSVQSFEESTVDPIACTSGKHDVSRNDSHLSKSPSKSPISCNKGSDRNENTTEVHQNSKQKSTKVSSKKCKRSMIENTIPNKISKPNNLEKQTSPNEKSDPSRTKHKKNKMSVVEEPSEKIISPTRKVIKSGKSMKQSRRRSENGAKDDSKSSVRHEKENRKRGKRARKSSTDYENLENESSDDEDLYARVTALRNQCIAASLKTPEKEFEVETLFEAIRSESGKMRFKCLVCNNSYCTKSYIKEHMRIHTGERPFVCDICSRPFRNNFMLKAHLEFHFRDTKTYTCNICKKEFKERFHLQSHLLVHTNERTFACNVCGRVFRDETGLQWHQLCHTPK